VSLAEATHAPPQPPPQTDPETAAFTAPNNVEAEQAALGGMLLDTTITVEILDTLTADDFYRPAHRIIYTAIADLHAAGEPIDPVTVATHLIKTRQITKTGGGPYLHTCMATVPTAANAPHYARIVAEQAVLRRLVEAGTRITQLGQGNTTATGLEIDDVVVHAQLALHTVTEQLDRIGAGRTANGPHAIDWDALWATPTAPPDYLAGHILAAGKTVVIYSPGKAGKSLLAIEIAAALATGNPVIDDHHRDPMTILYVDQEMTPEDWRDRLTDMGYGPDDDLTRLHLYQLQDWPPLDTPAGGQALAQAATSCGAQLVIIDTLSKVVAGVENENDTHQAFYRHTLIPLKRDGRTALVLDHTGKDITRGARGGSAKTDNVDLVWELLARGRNSVSLKRTHTRFRHDIETIWLDRKSGPLRHVAQPINQEAEKLVETCAEYIRAFTPNATTSRGEMARELRSANLQFRNDTISEAWRRVRQENGWAA
jgi:hypothetical protein